MKKLLLTFSVIISSIGVFAQSSVGCDSAFIGAGVVITNLSTSDNEANSMLIQKDGKIVVAGYSNARFALVRYGNNGILDQAFGSGGFTISSIRGGDDHTSATAIQSDGKIVVAGSMYNGSTSDFVILRYNPDGKPDTLFGDQGKTVTSVRKWNDNATALVIQSDGKIVVAGSSNDGSDYDFAVLRYKENGTLDSSFGKAGIVITNFLSGNDRAEAAAVQTDGKIIVVGYSNTDIAAVRYLSDGRLDPSFGTGGKVVTSLRSGEDQASAVSIQTDGRIVVSGSSFNGDSFDFAMVRYNANGSLDPSFGKGGIVTTSIRDADDRATALSIQSDHKIVVAGSSNNGIVNDFALVRYNPNGTLDPSFGNSGIVVSSVRKGDEQFSSVALQPDGKIVVAGNSNDGISNDFALIRYNTNGSYDKIFGNEKK